jgi:hypothetical protein
MTISILKSPKEMLFEQAGIPHMQAGGSPSLAKQQASLAHMATNGSNKYKPKNAIVGYRAAGDGKVETLPTTFDKDKVTNYVNAYLDAKDQFGLPAFTPEQLINRLLVEGQSDFGYNQYDTNNKKANEIFQTMQNYGYGREAGFPAAIYSTHHRSQAHNVPFDVAWNGEGRSKKTGLTGWDYNDRMSNSTYAATHPQNAELLKHVSSLMQPPQINDADLTAQMPSVDIMSNPTGYKNGGKIKPFRDMSKVLIQKHISGN